MLIRVIYHDNRQDMVLAEELDELIAGGKIRQFLRSTGWVILGYHPIRRIGRESMTSSERRVPANPPIHTRPS